MQARRLAYVTMIRSTHKKSTARAFVRGMPGCSERYQLARLDKAASFPVVYNADALKTDPRIVRDSWLRTLDPGSTGWIWRLSLIAAPKPIVDSPTLDYVSAVAIMLRRVGAGATIIEGDSGITSADERGFLAAIERGFSQVARGRRLTPSVARTMGEPGRRQNVERSAKVRLRRELKSNKSVIMSLWRDDAAYPTYAAAAEAINAYLTEQGLAPLGEAITVYRALKGRNS